MPSLGVCGNTPFSQGTNYHTARNHCFRDGSSYSVQAQMRLKCPSCGIWGLRGSHCKLCNVVIPGNAAIFAKQNNNAMTQGRSVSPSASHGRSGSPRVGSTTATTTPRRTAATPRSTTPTTGSRKPCYVQRKGTTTPVRTGTATLRRMAPNSATTPKQQQMKYQQHRQQMQRTSAEEFQEQQMYHQQGMNYEAAAAVRPVEVQFPGQEGESDVEMGERTAALAEVFGDAPQQHQNQKRHNVTLEQQRQHEEEQRQYNLRRQERTQALAERFGEKPRQELHQQHQQQEPHAGTAGVAYHQDEVADEDGVLFRAVTEDEDEHQHQQQETQQPMQQQQPYQAHYERSASARSASARSSSQQFVVGARSGGKKAAPSAAAKVKCHYCGVWVAPNRMCALCRTPN